MGITMNIEIFQISVKANNFHNFSNFYPYLFISVFSVFSVQHLKIRIIYIVVVYNKANNIQNSMFIYILLKNLIRILTERLRILQIIRHTIFSIIFHA